MKAKGLLGIVVLYNPDYSFIDKIIRYLDAVDLLIIFDNSSNNCDYIEQIKKIDVDKIHYVHNGENKGISYALNYGLRYADLNGYDYLLTMDQDSEFSSENVLKLYSKCKVNYQDIAIHAPMVKFKNENTFFRNKKTHSKYVDFAITSGNIINVKIILSLGGFDDYLFIDGVDRDLCLNITKAKKRIFIDSSAILEQQLGDGKINILNIAPHSPIRNYYIARNRRYIVNKHKDVFVGFRYIKAIYLSELKQLFSILVFERNKIKKIQKFFEGIKDYEVYASTIK